MTGGTAAGRWASTWTPTQYARNGTVKLAYDRLSGSEGDPLLLVMGLAVSRFWWPAGLGQAFADRRFAVARYDQRDAGQSTRMPDTGGSNPFSALARQTGGLHLRGHDRRRGVGDGHAQRRVRDRRGT